jgi:hypothetical protein
VARAKKSQKKPKKAAGAGLDWRAVGHWSSRVVSVLALIALAVGMTFGVGAVRDLAAQEMAPQGPLAVSIAWPRLPGTNESWLPARDQEELLLVAERAAGSGDALSVAPLRAVSEALGRTGWFVAPPAVRVVEPGRLAVTGEWRQPAAVVRWRDRDHLISTRGMPMPPVYMPGGSNRPVIFGCRYGPEPVGLDASRYEQLWPGRDVAVGLELLGVLARAGLLEQVAGVDVGPHASGGALEIVTAHGTRVVWGSPPDEWKPGEPGVEERLSRLRGLLARTGRIDGGQRRIEIHRARVEIDLTAGG